uniref:VOC domain-containing protein n=1 Tax=Pinguiococcus pyrenoidosus TaxID=172671 RepID=A0A7R9YFL1_9STRA|mmetsp:Transcript_8577/g.32259  ORF Transcript_8577/g.32259 Transcript_8577/m.32259 type:complete len:179 (+) Transcript_8577:56-592(+)
MMLRRQVSLLGSALLLRPLAASLSSSSSSAGGHPIPPFHYAFPVHDLKAAKSFYGGVMGCSEGRSSVHWQDYNLYGHQIVCHFVGEGYRCQDYINPVDNMEVPVPHAGIVLLEDQFLELAARLRKANVEFVIEPQKRFIGAPGEQWTMFFKDQSGNNLEFKAMAHPGNLFAKYNVPEG